MINLKEIDKFIEAIKSMLQIWDTDELKELLCQALEIRSLLLLNNCKGIEDDIILN